MREGSITRIPKSEKGNPAGAQVKTRTRALKRKVIKSSSRSLGLVISTYQSWDIDLLVCLKRSLRSSFGSGIAAIVFLLGESCRDLNETGLIGGKRTQLLTLCSPTAFGVLRTA